MNAATPVLAMDIEANVIMRVRGSPINKKHTVRAYRDEPVT